LLEIEWLSVIIKKIITDMTKTTIQDIAKQMDMSVNTVCRALQNSTIVKQETRNRIYDLAQSLGCKSSQFAKNLKDKDILPLTIGIIIPTLDSYLMSSIFSGIESIASNAGFNLIVSQSLGSGDQEITNAAAMFNYKVDGLLVSLSHGVEDMQHFDSFLENGIPIVFFDKVPDQDYYTKVTIDNRKASKEATSHLISQGCRRIVHMTVKSDKNIYAKRFQGYKDALESAGILFDENLVIYNDLSRQAGEDAAEKILNMEQLPDAVFAPEDECAVSCMIALKKAGIKIPIDIAFAGFNNDLNTQLIEPNLTTINYPGRQIGERAMRYLIDALNNESSKAATLTAFLRSELVVRESSLKDLGKRDKPINRTSYLNITSFSRTKLV
jgi:LacI family transcriptional regulator